jgi:ABC-type multidrug transport system fused ATPase/permease subunit
MAPLRVDDSRVVTQWVSPLSWAVRSIAQNEFYSKDYDNILPNGVRAGTFYLDSYDIYLSHGWKWAGVGYLAFFYVFSLLLCIVALKYIAKQHVRKSPHIEDPNSNIAPTLRVSAASEAIKHVKSRPSGDVQHEDSSQSGPAEKCASRLVPPLSHVFCVAEPGTRVPVGSVSLPVEPVSIVFRNISYSVPAGKSEFKTLLNQVSGYALPGTMTALMGSSGMAYSCRLCQLRVSVVMDA